MSWGKLTRTERRQRTWARNQIILAANRHKIGSRPRWDIRPVRLYTSRQIQRAVFACRQNRLVSDELLALAGYRPNRHPAVVAARREAA